MDTNNTIVIYARQSSNRLQYILQWLFVERLGRNYILTDDINAFRQAEGMKINYTPEAIDGFISIMPHSLLFETHICEQPLSIQRWKKTTVLFYNQPKGLIPFDLFAACFYLMVRYEEYLNKQLDQHGRYPHQQSLAFTYGFLDIPVIDIWLHHFAHLLNATYHTQLLKDRQFVFKPSYDIDIAWAYQHKPLHQLLLGGVKEAVLLKWKSLSQRLGYLINRQTDPYDSFKWLAGMHDRYQLRGLFFFLVAANKTAFDRNASPASPPMQQLIQQLATGNDIGLHPSYYSGENREQLASEKQTLQTIAKQEIQYSRQHFIRLQLPATYRQLLAIGVKEDFSMGYPGAQGFRAGTSHSFLWFDLEQDIPTSLRVHPFCFMDATAIFYLKQQPEQALQAAKQIVAVLQSVKGCFMPIMHNYTIGTAKYHKGWAGFYEALLAYIATTSR